MQKHSLSSKLPKSNTKSSHRLKSAKSSKLLPRFTPTRRTSSSNSISQQPADLDRAPINPLLTPPPSALLPTSQQTSSSKLPTPPPPPLALPDALAKWSDSRIKSLTTTPLIPVHSRYNSDHVKMISTLLTKVGSECPWDHEKGSFAHPGLIFFLNSPYQQHQYEYVNSQVGPQQPVQRKLLRINSLETVNPFTSYSDPANHSVNDPTIDSMSHSTSIPPGCSNHVVLGGSIQWKEPISVHSQRLLISHLPAQRPHLNRRRKFAKLHPTNQTDTKNNSNTLRDEFIQYDGVSAVSAPDYKTPYIFRTETHAFFPERDFQEKSQNIDKLLLPQDIASYNRKVDEYNHALTTLKELQDQSEAHDSTHHNLDNLACLPHLTDGDLKELALREQLALPNDQVSHIQAELNSVYTQLYNEFISSSKPALSGFSSKQQLGYLYSSIGSILKRRFKKSLEYDWKWSNQRVSLDTIAEFNAYTQNNNLLLHDDEYARSLGFPGRLISPHFFAFLALDYLGAISQDTTPLKPPIWDHIEEKLIEVQKNKAKVEYQEFKAEKKKINQMVKVHQEFMESAKQQLQSEQSVNDPADVILPEAFYQTEQQLLEKQNASLSKDQEKDLLKQRLQIQPWHTIYQQLSQYDYRQTLPFPAPEPVSIVTNTTTHDQNGTPITTTTTTTKENSIVFDVYAKVITEHESFRNNRMYQTRLRKKIEAALIKGEKYQQKLAEAQQSGTSTSLSQSMDGFDPESTVLLSDLIRQSPLKVKLWIEGTPIITTTIKTTTQRPKVAIPVEESETDDDLDIFNKNKQRKSRLESDTRASNEPTVEVVQMDPKKTSNRKIDEEYLHPSTKFEVTNIPVDPSSVADPAELFPHNIDSTSVITETIEQEEHYLDITHERYQMGTVYFDSLATFTNPHLTICGLPAAQIEQLIIQEQKDGWQM